MLFRSLPSTLLSLALLCLPHALADLVVAAPSGAKVGQLTVTWTSNNDDPPLSSLAGSTIQLMAGGNTDTSSEVIATIGASASALKAVLAVPASGPTDKNAFYIRIQTVALGPSTGSITNYSPRFSVSGMTGTWSSPAAQADFKALPAGTTAGPKDVNAIGVTPPGGGGQPGAAGSGANQGSYAISYLLQTGLTKYAPMQPKPGTKITATNTSPLNPSFPWTVATTFLPIPSQVTTSTQVPTYSGTSIENTAAAAAKPTDDMQKYLNRWKD